MMIFCTAVVNLMIISIVLVLIAYVMLTLLRFSKSLLQEIEDCFKNEPRHLAIFKLVMLIILFSGVSCLAYIVIFGQQ